MEVSYPRKLKDYIVKEAVVAEDKRFERKRRTKQAKPPDAQLSILPKNWTLQRRLEKMC